MRLFLTVVDSDEALPDSSGHQPVPGEVSACFFLLTFIAMRRLQDRYHSIALDRRTPTHPVPILSDSWLNHYAYFCTQVLPADTCKLLATGCYRHADASKPILFDSPRRADSNGTLPDSGGHLPAEVSAFFILLTSIAMRTLRDLYHSIPLARRTPMRPFPTLADICPLRYLPFSSC